MQATHSLLYTSCKIYAGLAAAHTVQNGLAAADAIGTSRPSANNKRLYPLRTAATHLRSRSNIPKCLPHVSIMNAMDSLPAIYFMQTMCWPLGSSYHKKSLAATDAIGTYSPLHKKIQKKKHPAPPRHTNYILRIQDIRLTCFLPTSPTSPRASTRVTMAALVI